MKQIFISEVLLEQNCLLHSNVLCYIVEFTKMIYKL